MTQRASNHNTASQLQQPPGSLHLQRRQWNRKRMGNKTQTKVAGAANEKLHTHDP